MTGTEYMMECMTKDLVLLLMERRHIDMETALETLYTSDTFAKLKDSRTRVCILWTNANNNTFIYRCTSLKS